MCLLLLLRRATPVKSSRRTNREPDRVEAAEILRRLLDEIESGGIEAGTGHAADMRRRLEGVAVTALEADGIPERAGSDPY